MTTPRAEDLTITRLGEPTIPSPFGGQKQRYTDKKRILVCADTDGLEPFTTTGELPAFEEAGPAARVFFDPGELTCGIVTCGGLCPGLNDVVRSIVLALHHGYGVNRVLGYRYGYTGMTADPPAPPLVLDPATVQNIHRDGGSLLGVSRGPQDVGKMVDQLERDGVGILFALGGDGTLQGASELAQEALRRKLPMSVIGVPKTIDNDLVWTERSFGFATAADTASSVITAANAEATSAWNGIGLIKLMGRHSGFIAAYATLASGDVNFCLVPEVPFALDGDNGLLNHIEKRLEARRHAVIVVAEGAGQDLMQNESEERDASGNVRLMDIGVWLRERIKSHLAERNIPVDIKYIDPSYIIRSLAANSADSAFCLLLGQHAVHAGMAGCTDMMVGYWKQHFTHVPMSMIRGQRKQIEPTEEIWQRVLDTTGQPATMR